jgi:cell division GTPase FtsZ
MGTGIGKGENRGVDAAQQAISSPLLDNVSVAGERKTAEDLSDLEIPTFIRRQMD